ncbi:MAG TPA: O-antigen ligase family protein [Mucilaginibacter sp.]|jgi:O-antigen ligase
MSSIGNKFNQEYWISVLNFATIFFVIAFLNKNINDLKKLYRLLSFINRLVFVVAIFTIIAFAFERVRIELTTNNTNYLAYFLGIGFSIALFLPESKKSKIIPPVIGLAILCTSSRIVVISSVIIILIYILSRKRKRVLNLLLIALALITTVGFVDISKYFDQSRYANINQDASTVERIEIIQTSKKIIAENPVNGIGYSQFQYEFLHYVSKNTEYLANAEEIVTHNDFIRVIDELGLPALVFFLYMIITQFVILWKLPAVLRLLLVGVFISNISYSTSHNNLNSFVFWFLLTLPGMVSYLISKEKYVKKIR